MAPTWPAQAGKMCLLGEFIASTGSLNSASTAAHELRFLGRKRAPRQRSWQPLALLQTNHPEGPPGCALLALSKAMRTDVEVAVWCGVRLSVSSGCSSRVVARCRQRDDTELAAQSGAARAGQRLEGDGACVAGVRNVLQHSSCQKPESMAEAIESCLSSDSVQKAGCSQV